MSETTNLGLAKPAATDYYNIEIHNDNMDIIDEAVAQKATVSYFTATLTSSGWSATAPYTQTVTVSGVLATDKPIVDVVQTGTAATDRARLEAWAMVTRITTAAGSITATCLDDKPTVNIPIHMEVVR